MPAYISRSKEDLLRSALQKIQKDTQFTAIGPGSIIRAIGESVSQEVADLYSIMDYNTSMTVLSTASGRALDLFGELYNLPRKSLTPLATEDQRVGQFYFYLDQPYDKNIRIPAGTKVYTRPSGVVDDQFTYVTKDDVIIPAGRTRAYVEIGPEYSRDSYTAGKDTLVTHNFSPPEGAVVRCTNPKPIPPSVGAESDENYRTRIIAQVRTSAGGTLDSLRFTGLAVDGVRDVKVRNSPYGLGTAEVLVVPEDNKIGLDYVARVQDSLKAVAPVGVRIFVREPDYISVTLEGGIVVPNRSGLDTRNLSRRAENAVKRFISRLLPGETLIYAKLLESVLDSSDLIQDFSITRLRVNGTEVLRKNYRPQAYQQIVPGPVAIEVLQS